MSKSITSIDDFNNYWGENYIENTWREIDLAIATARNGQNNNARGMITKSDFPLVFNSKFLPYNSFFAEIQTNIEIRIHCKNNNSLVFKTPIIKNSFNDYIIKGGEQHRGNGINMSFIIKLNEAKMPNTINYLESVINSNNKKLIINYDHKLKQGISEVGHYWMLSLGDNIHQGPYGVKRRF